jgi:flagellar secretion chaperone FliS
MGSPGIDVYRRQQIEAMSPEELVLVIFEQGILACRRKDHRQARRVITELIGSLSFDEEEIAYGLLSIYDWILQLVREGKFEEAGTILKDLHATWAQAIGEMAEGGTGSADNEQEGPASLDVAS